MIEPKPDVAASTDGWLPIESAPKDGTHILAKLHREAINDMDDIRRPAFTEVREIWYRPYSHPIFGGNMPWHAGDPFDSHEGMAPDHFGASVPISLMPSALIASPSGETIQSAMGERSEASPATGEPPVGEASPNRDMLKTLKLVASYIDQPGQQLRDLYPVFGLDGRRVREAVNTAIAKAGGG